MYTGGIPQDGFLVHTLFQPVTIVYSILASIGIIFSCLCLIFNIVFRMKR